MDHAIKMLPQVNEKWAHHSGKQYEVLLLANTDAIDHDKFPITVVYSDGNHVWSRPAAHFVRKFRRV